MTTSQIRQKKGTRGNAHPNGSTSKLGAKTLGRLDLIRRVQIGLSDEQYDLMKEMMHFTNQTTEEYITHAIKSMLAADADNHYRTGDPRRDAAFKVLEGFVK